MRIAQFSIAVVALIAFVCPLSSAELTTEPLTQIHANIEKGTAVLIDVREKKEWDAGHVEGAISLPLSNIQAGLSKEQLQMLPKTKTLYTHCVVGKRALAAANELEKLGYKARPIKPGYKELIAAGFPKAKVR